MKLWAVSWGYGDYVTFAETHEEAIEKFLKEAPILGKPKEYTSMGKILTYVPIEEMREMPLEVEWFGE